MRYLLHVNHLSAILLAAGRAAERDAGHSVERRLCSRMLFPEPGFRSLRCVTKSRIAGVLSDADGKCA